MSAYPEAPDFERVQGETDPIDLQVLIDGAPQDITGSSWKWYMAEESSWLGADYDPLGSQYRSPVLRDPVTTNKVNGASMTIESASTGKIRWTPTTDDTDTPVTYRYQVKGVLSDGTIVKLPRTVDDPDAKGGRLVIHPSLA